MLKPIALSSLVLLISVSASAQINVDSLQSKLANFKLADSVSTEEMIVKTYASFDSSETYRVNYDLDGNLMNDEFWDIAITCRKFDSKGREIEFSQYEKDGTLAERDTPPIIQSIYNDEELTRTVLYLNENREPEAIMEQHYDNFGREIKLSWFDGSGNLKDYYTYTFDDVEHTRTERHFDAKSNLQTNGCEAAVIQIKFAESGFIEDRTTWLEERFFDKHMKLIDCEHYYINERPYSIVVRTPINENSFRMVLLNSKHEVIIDKVVTKQND